MTAERESTRDNRSPIERFLDAADRLDLEAMMAPVAPDPRLLAADGQRGEGSEAVRAILTGFLASIRSMTHRITAQWHVDNVWIAEVDGSYELRDWLRLDHLPRVFVARASPEGITDLRVYGSHERPMTEHRTGEEGMWVGSRWIPPL